MSQKDEAPLGPPVEWSTIQEAIAREWRPDPAVPLDAATALSAMAFGYGSRVEHPQREWDELEPDLAAAWAARSGREKEAAWQLVREAARHGWTAREERLVQGGRPDAPLLEPQREPDDVQSGEGAIHKKSTSCPQADQ